MNNSFNHTIPNLSTKTVHAIQDVMLDTCLAFELGGDYKKVLLKAKNKSLGAKKKAIQHLLDNSGQDSMDRLSSVFALN